MDFYGFVCFIYYFLLFRLANSLSFLVARFLDEDDEENQELRYGDEESEVSIATNSSSVFQDAQEESDADEFDDAPLGKWVPRSRLFAGCADFCQNQDSDECDDDVVDEDDVESLISVSPTPSTPEPPPSKRRDLRSDPFLFKRRKTLGDRLRSFFSCGCYKPRDRYYFL